MQSGVIFIKGPTGGVCIGSKDLLKSQEGFEEITEKEYKAIKSGADTKEDEGTAQVYLTEYVRPEGEDNAAGIDILATSLEEAKEKAVALGEDVNETVIVVGTKEDQE